VKKSCLVLVIALVAVLASSFHGRAATWYLEANQTVDWNTLSIWWSQPLGGGTHPTAISSSDYFDMNGYSCYTPKISSGTTTFGGKQFVLNGGGYLATKTLPSGAVYVQNFYSYGGILADAAETAALTFGMENFQVNGSTTISGGGVVGRTLRLNVTTLKGPGDVCFIGGGGGSAGGGVTLTTSNAAGLSGTLYVADGCQFTFGAAMTVGGPVVVEGAGTVVTTNYAITVKSLTINGTAKAAGTYTAASLGFSGTGSVVVQSSPTTTTPKANYLYGVNLPGGSFSSGAFYPTDPNEWSYYSGKKLNLIRVAFEWERIQPTLGGALSTSTLASLDQAVSYASAHGMKVILDMHNYDRYSGTIVGTSPVTYTAYQGVWQLIAAHYAGNSAIYGYDIMNEPHDDSSTWFTAAQYGVTGVRSSDTTHYIIVEGDSYAGAQSWMSVNWNLGVTDPDNLVIYSAHTYWDSNDSGVYSGTYDSNNDYPTIAIDRSEQFVYWLGLKGYTGYVGEFGVPNNVASPDYRWNEVLGKFMAYLNTSGVKATYWSGGECWGSSYALSCAVGTPPADAPAMSVLQQYGGGTH
jgi:aryl-phospho-beta-D-glucosidase BglC (GH1 family)